MEALAKQIAALRRKHGMTQEALAEMIGVSAQTISKWETSITCPDIALLPVIADVFGVTTDALFGRQEVTQAITAEAAIERTIEEVRRTIVSTLYHPATDGAFEHALETYRIAMSDHHSRSVIESSRDVLYFREELGALALRRPQNGWNSLLVDDKAAALLQLLADADFRRALGIILRKRMLSFTLPSLMRAAGISDEKHLRECIEASGLFVQRELLIDEAPLVYYELIKGEQQLYLIFAVYAFAHEQADYQPMHYCFIGNSEYFTP